jgi:integrase
LRLYLGEQDYRVETMADADDRDDANGATVLNFWQAQQKARDLHAQLTGPAVQTASRVYTVARAIEDYLQWLDGNRKSASDARWRVNALVLPNLGDKEVARLTAKDLRSWQSSVAKQAPRIRTRKDEDQKFREIDKDDPEERRRRRASANRVMSILKAALNYAWREGHVQSDKEWRRVEPYEGVEAARVHYLTINEAQRLLNASEPAFRNMVQAALQTGARYSELASLTVADFNSDVGTVAIRDSKSGKRRHIVLTEEGVTFFRGIVVGRSGSETMFRNRASRAWGKSHQARPMKEACTAAKINPPIGFHGLRHTWASLSVMNGVPLLVVAKNLGHADTRMVEKHYGHLAPSFVADAIRAGAPRFGTDDTRNVADTRAL